MKRGEKGNNKNISEYKNKNKNFLSERQKSKIEEQIKKKHIDEHPAIPYDLIVETQKSICKIIIDNKETKKLGSGFFLKVDDSKKYLITAGHIITKNLQNEDIHLELHNKKIMILSLKNRNIKFFPTLKGITLIEIKETDEIINGIKFLSYEINYTLGYNIYKNGYIYTIGYPRGEFTYGSGIVSGINDFEFEHNIPTAPGSGGSPILLLNNNIEEIRVIGIHRGALIDKNLKLGTFIGEIFKEKEGKNDGKIIIKFESQVPFINLPIVCNITDNFSILEEKLFKEFPDLKDKNIFFIAGGENLDRKASLEANKIKNDTTIIIAIIEEDDSD